MTECHDTEIASEVEYRDMPGFLGYRIGSDGSVWSCWEMGRWGRMTETWRRRKTPADKQTGYARVSMRPPGGRKKVFNVHALVLTAFVGPRPDGMEGCHCDGNKTNNAATNLRWDTSKSNHRDKIQHGSTNRGHPSVCALSQEQVEAIACELREGVICRVVAESYGLCTKTINCIRIGKTWGWLTGATRSNPLGKSLRITKRHPCSSSSSLLT